MTNRELLEANGCDEDIIIFENPAYEGALVGVTDDGRAVYDFELMVQSLMDADGISYDEAMEFVEYNTLRALSYYSQAPVVMYPLEKFE